MICHHQMHLLRHWQERKMFELFMEFNVARNKSIMMYFCVVFAVVDARFEMHY